MENENVIRSSYDKRYVSKKLTDKEDTTAQEPKTTDKPKTTKKTTTSKKTAAPKAEKVEPKKEEKPSQVAVYSEGKLAHPALGRLTKGYNIVAPETAEEWMKISNKVRMATPEEVAIAYGA